MIQTGASINPGNSGTPPYLTVLNRGGGTVMASRTSSDSGAATPHEGASRQARTAWASRVRV